MDNEEFFTADGEKTVEPGTSKKMLMITNHKRAGIITFAAVVGIAVLTSIYLLNKK